MSDLLKRIKEASVNEGAEILSKTDLMETESTDLGVPILNLAFSGRFDGGISSGHTVIAGPSRHFKSNIGLIAVRAYMKKYPDAVCIFYDSEFGARKNYFESVGVDPSRVVHIPLVNVEKLRSDLVRQLEMIKREEKVFIFVDSLGNLASKREIDNARDENDAADMTRAKQIKSLFRSVTSYLNLKDVPCITINHVYKEQGTMYPKDVVSGGTGVMFSADQVFIIGRQTDKEGKEVTGYKFILKAEKSRTIREGIKFPFEVSYEKGVNKWSGLLDIALATGHVERPTKISYTRPGVDDTKFKKKDTDSNEFWDPIFEQTDFKEVVESKLKPGHIFDEDDDPGVDVAESVQE